MTERPKETPDVELLRALVPFDSVSPAGLERFVERMELIEIPAGEALFDQGDRDDYAWWVVKGEIHLMDGERRVYKVVGGTDAARYVVAPRYPRPYTAVAARPSLLLRLGNEQVDIILTWDQSTGYAVEEVGPGGDDDDGDWMNRMLSSWIFHRIPPSNIQAVFTRMEPVTAAAGEEPVREGEAGDYFYVITRGRAEVVRGSGDGEERLAVLGPGDGFGEEALLSDARRNATVRMVGDGELMRLAREDFTELLHAPVIGSLGAEEAAALVGAGEAIWVDVRMENEFTSGHLEGAVGLPLARLRQLAGDLPQEKVLVICCETGRRSSAAAWLLCNMGFDARVLSGGLQSAPPTLTLS